MILISRVIAAYIASVYRAGAPRPSPRGLGDEFADRRRVETVEIVDRRDKTIEAAGAERGFPPSDSPDLDPVEKVFAELESALGKIARRTVDGLRDAIAIDDCPANECLDYFRNAGRRPTRTWRRCAGSFAVACSRSAANAIFAFSAASIFRLAFIMFRSVPSHSEQTSSN